MTSNSRELFLHFHEQDVTQLPLFQLLGFQLSRFPMLLSNAQLPFISATDSFWNNLWTCLLVFELPTSVTDKDQSFRCLLVSGPRSLKSVLVLPPQIFGTFSPPKKRVNFDKFNQRHKCVIFCPPSVC